MSFSRVQQRAAAGFMHSIARLIIARLIPRHSLDGSPPPLVVKAAKHPTLLVTLAPEEPGESPLELFAGAGVDHGVDAAVEVSQPKDHLEHSFRGLQRWEEGT